MSEELKLHHISAPLLNSVEYGKNLNEVFQNINENFRLLSNRDFVKGDKGRSIKAATYNLVDKKQSFYVLTNFGEAFVNAIISEYIGPDHKIPFDELRTDLTNGATLENVHDYLEKKSNNVYSSLKSISGIYIFDFLEEQDGEMHVTVLEEYDELFPNDSKVIGSVAPIVFKDLRFSKLNDVDDANIINWTDKVDTSCQVFCRVSDDKISFDVLHESPTIYYDETTKNFCWNINGNRTGLIANGPAGKDGIDSNTHIVKIRSNNNSPSTVSGYYNYLATGDELLWVQPQLFEDVQFIEKSGEITGVKASINVGNGNRINISLNKGDTCLAIKPNNGSDSDERPVLEMYFTKIYNITRLASNPSKIEAITMYCNQSTAIPTAFTAAMLESLQTYNINHTNSTLPGLHVPLTNPNQIGGGNEHYRHMLWSESPTNDPESGEGQGDRSYVHLSPIAWETQNQESDKEGIDSQSGERPLDLYNNEAILGINYNQVQFGTTRNIIKTNPFSANKQESSITIGDTYCSSSAGVVYKGIYNANYGDEPILQPLYINAYGVDKDHPQYGSVFIGGDLQILSSKATIKAGNGKIGWLESVASKMTYGTVIGGDLGFFKVGDSNQNINSIDDLLRFYSTTPIYLGKDLALFNVPVHIKGESNLGETTISSVNISGGSANLDSLTIKNGGSLTVNGASTFTGASTFKGDATFEKGLMMRPFSQTFGTHVSYNENITTKCTLNYSSIVETGRNPYFIILVNYNSGKFSISFSNYPDNSDVILFVRTRKTGNGSGDSIYINGTQISDAAGTGSDSNFPYCEMRYLTVSGSSVTIH